MTQISGPEISLVLIILVSGLIGNIVFYYQNADSKKYKKWNYTVYGGAIIFLIFGFIPPSGFFNNVIFSVPLIIIYQLMLKRHFKKT